MRRGAPSTYRKGFTTPREARKMAPAAGAASWPAEPVPDSANGLDVARARRIVLHFLAQIGDVDVHHVVAAEVIVSPYALQELPSAEDEPRARGQSGEQLEL